MEGSDCDVTISDGEFEKKCDEKGGVSDANERLRGVTNQKKVKWLLDPGKYGIPVYEQSQMTPEGGTKYVFEWDDGIFNEDWISDGYRWRNYSLLAQLVRPSIRRLIDVVALSRYGCKWILVLTVMPITPIPT
ncbi:hypothetical protein OUZ56_029611 [Daphnia magna]|uniref:Uncharacterized protein n=1 Tax=Daphnia magna TaxID=35525 RepID=A0ABR0B7C0_9CRUS|nr:hypothetical protein OUZ56_029611 [Daphnia magna]